MSEETSEPDRYSLEPTAPPASDTVYVLRGQRVMLDRDVCQLYAVPLAELKCTVRLNQRRFPEDFMFTCNGQEFASLKEEGVLGETARYAPMVFTERGVTMLSTVLDTPAAIEVNLNAIRGFVHLKEVAENHERVASKVEEMEGRYDMQFQMIIGAIQQLSGTGEEEPNKPEETDTTIGFNVKRTSTDS